MIRDEALSERAAVMLPAESFSPTRDSLLALLAQAQPDQIAADFFHAGAQRQDRRDERPIRLLPTIASCETEQMAGHLSGSMTALPLSPRSALAAVEKLRERQDLPPTSQRIRHRGHGGRPATPRTAGRWGIWRRQSWERRNELETGSCASERMSLG